MPDLDLLTSLAAAYQDGQAFGRIVRWLVLLAVGAGLVRRLVRGSFGPGFRRSPAGTVMGLVAVVAGLIFSFAHDTGRDDRETAQMRAGIVAGCRDSGTPQSFCDCYADEVVARTDHDPEKLEALKAELGRMTDPAHAPALLVRSAQACTAKVQPS